MSGTASSTTNATSRASAASSLSRVAERSSRSSVMRDTVLGLPALRSVATSASLSAAARSTRISSAGGAPPLRKQPSLRSASDRSGTTAANISVASSAVLRYEVVLPAVGAISAWWAFLVRWKNVRMTAVALAFWVVAVAVQGWASHISWVRGAAFGMVGTPPLHDIVHEALPDLQRLRVVPEIGHTLPVLHLVGLMLAHFDQRALDSGFEQQFEPVVEQRLAMYFDEAFRHMVGDRSQTGAEAGGQQKCAHSLSQSSA